MREIQAADLDPDNLNPENFCSSGLKVHPVAHMFPLMEGKEFELFCIDIQAAGLNNPIVINGNVLLDGRNRLRACAKVKIKPKFTAYSSYRNREHEWIISQNIHRRSLTDDQRGAIATQIYGWQRRRRMAELKQLDVLQQQGAHGKEGGRGHKKPLGVKSPPRVFRRLRDEIVEQTGISEHKAKQAIQVAQHAPELLDGVVAGETKLRDAAKKAKTKSPPKPRSPHQPPWNMEKQCGRVMGLVRRVAAQCPSERRREFCCWIARQCEGITP
jgi:hypothetical protein